MAGLFRVLALLVICGVFTLTSFGPVAAQDGSGAATPEAASPGIGGAVAWLLPQQTGDGAFAGPSGEGDAGATLDAIVALTAAATAGVDTGDAIERAIAWLESGDVALVYAQTGAGQAAKLALGLSAAGIPHSGFAHVDPMSIVLNSADPDSGLYGTGVFDHALAVLALVATGNEVPPPAIDAFAATQAENGGWAFDASTDPAMADSNTTSMSIQALAAAGHGESEIVKHGLAYLDSIWIDGGAAYSTLPESLPDANSTALAIQAFIAIGRDPLDQVETLVMFQNMSGAFHFNAADTSDNLYASTGAIPGLALLALPINAVEPGATPIAFHDRIAA